MLPILVIQHEPTSPPGHLLAWLEARRIPWQQAHLDAIPADPAGFSAIVSLGSEQSANGTQAWLAPELELVQRALAEDVPVLGLCFGGQLLARAAGGTVAVTPPGEFGWIQPVGEPEPITGSPWFCWHDDAFTLPPGAELLANGAICPQAFALGPHVGFQFHPEVDEVTIGDWIRSRAEPHRAPLDLTPTIEANPVFLVGLQERAFRLFDWWLAHAGIPVGEAASA